MSLSGKPKVLVINGTLSETSLRILREKCEVIVCQGSPRPSREEILTKCEGVDGIIWNTGRIFDDEVLDRAGPQLKAVSTKSVGLEHIDLEAVKRRGVAFGYTPTVPNDAVADMAVGLMLAAARRFPEGNTKIRNNDWKFMDPTWLLGRDIKGSTVGIVGLGRIGQVIVKRLKGFDVGTFLYAGHVEKSEGKKLGAIFVPFDELLTRSDFVIVACALTNETRNLFDKAAFEKMKSTSVFVNIGRGGIVVQADLAAALKNGTIFAAGLDVMQPEPLSLDDPLLSLQNIVLMPHVSTATTNTQENLSMVCTQNVINGIEGKPMIFPAY